MYELIQTNLYNLNHGTRIYSTSSHIKKVHVLVAAMLNITPPSEGINLLQARDLMKSFLGMVVYCNRIKGKHESAFHSYCTV